MADIRKKSNLNQARKVPCRRRLRGSRGVYLVELLVAVTLGTVILFTLTSMLGTTMRLSARGQNEVYAYEILSELMEFTRGVRYSFLDLNRGTHTLLTNKVTPSDAGPTIRLTPVQLDFIQREWNSGTKSARFQGVVKYIVEDGPELNTIKVTVKIGWSDGSSYNVPSDGQAREISASTIVSEFGTGLEAP